MNSWTLPVELPVSGKLRKINTDYRDIIEIIGYLNDRELPELTRWKIAVSLFFEDDISNMDFQEAMEQLASFISIEDIRESENNTPAPKLIDWQQDSLMIISDVNKVAGMEIRSVPYMHWWTFLAYFNSVGEGQLSTVVSIRSKLSKKKKLESWEQEFYRENKKTIDFRIKETAAEKAERDRLNKLLDGK